MTAELVTGLAGATSLPPRTASVPIARKWIRRELAGRSGEFIDAAEMLGCEIITNAIRHGSGQVSVSYTVCSETLRFEVLDGGSSLEPTIRHVDVDTLEEGGWGLQLLTLFNAVWGTELAPDGNRLVWFELPIPNSETAPTSASRAPARSLDQDPQEV